MAVGTVGYRDAVRFLVPTLGPSYYWPLDELSGTTANDRTDAAGLPLTYSGTPRLAVIKGVGSQPVRAPFFDGTDDFAQGTVGSVSASMSHSCWVYAVDGVARDILGQMNTAGNNYVMGLFAQGGGVGSVTMWQTGGANHATINSTATGTARIPLNAWVHIGFTYSSGTALILYINGREAGRTTSFAGSLGTSTNFRIGGRADGGGTRWQGGIQHCVHSRNQVFTAHQMWTLYRAGLHGRPLSADHLMRAA